MASKIRTKPDLFAANCPTREVLDHITSTWGSLIMVLLLEKTYRFSELRKRIGGISEKMLAQNLQALEADGFLIRKAYPVIPPKVEYSLTPMGRDVAQHLETLVEWIENNLVNVQNHRDKAKRSRSKENSARPA